MIIIMSFEIMYFSDSNLLVSECLDYAEKREYIFKKINPGVW